MDQHLQYTTVHISCYLELHLKKTCLWEMEATKVLKSVIITSHSAMTCLLHFSQDFWPHLVLQDQSGMKSVSQKQLWVEICKVFVVFLAHWSSCFLFCLTRKCRPVVEFLLWKGINLYRVGWVILINCVFFQEIGISYCNLNHLPCCWWIIVVGQWL